jgi:hypothetical protein
MGTYAYNNFYPRPNSRLFTIDENPPLCISTLLAPPLSLQTTLVVLSVHLGDIIDNQSLEVGIRVKDSE